MIHESCNILFVKIFYVILQVLTFTSHIYHPAVDSNSGIFNLSQIFPQWDRKKDHIWQIFKYLLCVFHNVNVKVPVNVEASAA